MPVLKPISGHTSCKGPYRYLTKNGRALASDYLNLDVPEKAKGGDVFPWWKQMDAVRHSLHHDLPWNGRAPRTYKHYIVSPDPDDALDLESLRELTVAWVQKHFAEYQCAIVYHDDNESRIPHAHVIVSCSNVFRGNKLQDPDPGALNRSLQRLADDRHLRRFENMEGMAPLPAQERREQRVLQPKSLQSEYMRRAEVQLRSQGQYSWVADIRARVKIARSAAQTETEFRALLGELGVQVANNSAKAARADWIYSLADAPTRRVSGEKLGLAYRRESLLRRFEQKGAFPEAGSVRIAEIARSAVEVRDLTQLQQLADAVTLMERGQIKSVIALEAYMRRPYRKTTWNDMDTNRAAAAQRLIRQEGVLPFRTPSVSTLAPEASEDAYARTRPHRRSEASDGAQRERQRDGARTSAQRSRARENQER